ncbi:Dihydrofolate reductase [Streptomyces zhaozhouensis]|uniref:Dihydrofolate reductase n=1 Tax=Streptomyces zhaozhouensis TaxID=1300267 RepID=A0A286DY57_9ACTN|nr:dihydrofolate reductase family protein [Streptomyces zhaozhouensis]SOD63595.1 Dihydrofolate reductase [Streptomyces zhaozhouensis]
MAGRLIYSAITSLDGYLADESGAYEWSAPDEEGMALVSEWERAYGTYLLGRRMYEESVYWETAGEKAELSPVEREFADVWLAADKVVYSRTLDSVETARTRIEREFDVEAVRAMKAEATADLAVSGPTLAAPALAAGLVDEVRLLLNPVTVGGGLAAFPRGLRLRLGLLEERHLKGGAVALRYAVDGVESDGGTPSDGDGA